MDLSVQYLGLKLKTPLMVGASPIVDDLDMVKKVADAGASAIVMHSLFEEQIDQESYAQALLASYGDSYAEATSYLPPAGDYLLGPDAYLEQIRKVKSASGLPVIGSLNGVTAGGWLHYAKLIEEAGADALELNAYYVATQVNESATAVEDKLVKMVEMVCKETKLPVAVKLSPFYTALTHLSQRLVQAGAKGLVLFNRFYQPDIDVEELKATSSLQLSTSAELLLRLRWLALLSGRVQGSLGVTGGVHTSLDALKAVMAGADGVQLVSAVLKNGPEVISSIEKGLAQWLTEHEYSSLAQAKGSMSLEKSPTPEVFERGNYIKILQGYSRA
jgi:dihydroorotate dehydrogenase (fumarate)